jgi:hypothetical protein
LAFLVSQLEPQATRTDIQWLTTGLAGVEKVLAEIGAGRVPSDRCAALARVYQAALRRPILPAGESPEGLHMPLLGEAYINPDFRAAQVRRSKLILSAIWWVVPRSGHASANIKQTGATRAYHLFLRIIRSILVNGRQLRLFARRTTTINVEM